MTNFKTSDLVLQSDYADTLVLKPSPMGGESIIADGVRVGTLTFLKDRNGPCLVMLNTPVPCDLISAPNSKDAIGLALRTYMQLCAKVAFTR